MDLFAADLGGEELRQLRSMRTVDAGRVSDVRDNRRQFGGEVDIEPFYQISTFH